MHIDDMILVSIDDHVIERLPSDDGQVVLDRHAARIDVELREERRHRQRLLELDAVAIDRDGHGQNLVGAYRAGVSKSR